MKIRSSFVSNSSSCSFVLNAVCLNDIQKLLILNAGTVMDAIYADKNDTGIYGWKSDIDSWHIEQKGNMWTFHTDMDNFDFKTFLKDIGVPEVAFEDLNHSNDIWR